MANNYVNNLHDYSNGNLKFSRNSILPNFLIGYSKLDESPLCNYSKDSRIFNKSSGKLEVKTIEKVQNVNAAYIGSKRKGPPISNLWYRSPKSYRSSDVSPFSKSEFNQSSNIKDSDSFNAFVRNRNVNVEDPFDNWVTVFGYLPGQTQHILAYFSEFGSIIERIIPNNGNWMHLQYENKIHSVTALNKNGKIINNMVMIGVKPCSDKTVEIQSITTLNNKDNKENIDKSSSSSNDSMRSLVSSFNRHSENTMPRTSVLRRALSVFWRN